MRGLQTARSMPLTFVTIHVMNDMASPLHVPLNKSSETM